MFKRKSLLFIMILFSCISLCFLYSNKKTSACSSLNVQESINKEDIKEQLEAIYKKRCNAFTSLDLESIHNCFDTSHKYGKWSLEHEIRRIKYLNDWSSDRGIKFTNIESSIDFKKIYPTKRGIRVGLNEIYKFDYEYKDDEDHNKNSFGVSLQHTVDLVNKNGDWVIFTDWYTDCFEDALKAYSGNIDKLEESNSPAKYKINSCSKEPKNNYGSKYNREKAVEYANKYCGIPWASGNNLRHNKRYKNFTGAGGDCTNYISQVLGDKEAGGLPFDGTWHCRYNKYSGADGSKAWVNADAFRNYVLYSGKGQLIKKGSFQQLIKPVDGYECGVVQKLELGSRRPSGS